MAGHRPKRHEGVPDQPGVSHRIFSAIAAQNIVVDLTECEFIDSTGVRALLLSREAQRSEGDPERLAVAASSEQILRILSVMGVDQVIPIHPTVEEAAAALAG